MDMPLKVEHVHVNPCTMSALTFSVGGVHFSTARDTLLKEPTSRLALIARGILPAARDDEGTVFLDRDPKYFQLLLNFLRDGWCLLPRTNEEKRELLQEVRYYQLSTMESWVRSQEVTTHLVDPPPLNPVMTSPGTESRPQDPFSTPSRSSMTSMSRPPSCTPSPRVSTIQPQECRCPSYRVSQSPLAGPLCSPQFSPTHTVAAGPFRPIEASCAVFSPARRFSRDHGQAPQVQEDFKWTAKYIKNNERLRDVVATLLELVHLPPHKSLHAGKTWVSLRVPCDHQPDNNSTTKRHGVTAPGSDRLRSQTLQVRGSMGWTFEFSIQLSSDPQLSEKYDIAEFIQDNWFVMTAVLKDQYGLALEEDSSARPACATCRRNNLTISVHRIV